MCFRMGGISCAAGISGCEHAQIAVLDGSGTPLGAACTEQKRMDILGEFPEAVPDETHGFELTFEAPKENYLRLALKGGGKKVLYLVNCKKMLSGEGRSGNDLQEEYALSEAERPEAVYKTRL